jgi:hypothetical protein
VDDAGVRDEVRIQGRERQRDAARGRAETTSGLPPYGEEQGEKERDERQASAEEDRFSGRLVLVEKGQKEAGVGGIRDRVAGGPDVEAREGEAGERLRERRMLRVPPPRPVPDDLHRRGDVHGLVRRRRIPCHVVNDERRSQK